MSALTSRRTAARHAMAAGAVLLLALGVAGCSSDEPDASPEPTTSATTASPTPTPPPTADAAPSPDPKACYDLGFDAAVSPTSDADPRGCRRPHTAQTYRVGRLDTVVDGHLLAVDSQRVQDDVAQQCPARLGDWVGGSADDLRLSMLRSVWFTPTVAESDAGADWYQCDVIALAGSDKLSTTRGSLEDALATPEGRTQYGMCGTAAPDADDFDRVPCNADHSWRAIEVVGFDDAGGPYPGVGAARDRGRDQCETAGRDAAADPLNFDWGYEFPDADQWKAGQTYGRCWVPD